MEIKAQKEKNIEKKKIRTAEGWFRHVKKEKTRLFEKEKRR